MRSTHGSALRLLFNLGACAAALSLSGCGSTSWEDVHSKEVVWVATAEAQLALFVLIQSEGVFGSTPEQFAAQGSAGVVGRLGSCAVATVSGAQVTYQFSDCKGAWGITGLTGKVEATYSFVDGNDPNDFAQVRMVGQDLSINGRITSFDRTGANTLPLRQWEGLPDKSFRVTLRETSKEDATKVSEFDEFEGDYRNDDCKVRDQSAPAIRRGQGFVIDDDTWETEVVEPYHTCDGRCPMVGGQVKSVAPDGPWVEFDGTASAIGHVGNDGETMRLSLSCTP